jgi:hypothetical protein
VCDTLLLDKLSVINYTKISIVPGERDRSCFEVQKNSEFTDYYNQTYHYVCSMTNADPIGRAVWGVGLRPLVWWDYGFEFRQGAWLIFSCEWCVLSGRDFCVGLITRPEEFYRKWCVWVWSWSLDNEETLAHWGLSCNKKKYDTHIVLYSYCILFD